MTQKKLNSVESPDSIKGIMARAPESWAELPFRIRIAKASRIFRAKLRKKDIEKHNPFHEPGGSSKGGQFARKIGNFTASMAKKLVSHIAANFGFTMEFADFDHYDGTGLVVGVGALYGGAIIEANEPLFKEPKKLAKHINTIKAKIRTEIMSSSNLSDELKSRLHIGGWVQENKDTGISEIHIEPSVTFPQKRLEVAKTLGRELGEFSIWDALKGEEIKL